MARGRRLGDAYSCIYPIHTAFVSAVLGLVSRHGGRRPDGVILATAFLVAAGGGLGLHSVAERPIVAWSQRLIFAGRVQGR